jgi:hypothetical protein
LNIVLITNVKQTVIDKQPKLLHNKRLLETSFSVQNTSFDTNYSILHISSEEKSCDNRAIENCCSNFINRIFNSCKCNDEFKHKIVINSAKNVVIELFDLFARLFDYVINFFLSKISQTKY